MRTAIPKNIIPITSKNIECNNKNTVRELLLWCNEIGGGGILGALGHRLVPLLGTVG